MAFRGTMDYHYAQGCCNAIAVHSLVFVDNYLLRCY